MSFFNGLKKAARASINAIGFDIARHKDKPHAFAWATSLHIRTVIDVGANVGQFASEIREALPGAMIYSFEPVKASYERLCESMRDDRHFKGFPFALGDAEGQTTINVNAHSPSSSLLPLSRAHTAAYPRSVEAGSETIGVRRLDDVFSDTALEPNMLIKLDVQGFEDKVIDGGTETMKKAKALVLEMCFEELYEGQKLFDDIYARIIDLGFVYRGSVNTKLTTEGLPLFEDGVFIRP